METLGEPFGSCPCGGEFTVESVQVTMLDGVRTLDVEQGRCTQCGGRVYKADTLERIEATYRVAIVAAPERVAAERS